MKSLTIIQDTRAGLLAEITTLLEHHQVNLLSIDGSTVGNMAVINLIADPYAECVKALQEAGFKVFASEQILVRIEDHPGALAELSRSLANVQVDIRSIHFVSREGDHCIVALETENDFSARQVLRDLLV